MILKKKTKLGGKGGLGGPVSHEISELGNIGIIPIFPREISELLFNRKKKMLVTIFNFFFIKFFL